MNTYFAVRSDTRQIFDALSDMPDEDYLIRYSRHYNCEITVIRGQTVAAARHDYVSNEKRKDEMYEYMPLDWTTEPPTVEGWYWAYTKYQAGNYTEKKKVVMCYLNSERVWQYEPDNTEDFPDETGFICWIGPLPIPEPPLK